MNKLIVLIVITSGVVYCESARTCNSDEQFLGYRTAIKATCSNSKIRNQIQLFTSISSNLVGYVTKIMISWPSWDFKLKSQVIRFDIHILLMCYYTCT